MTRLPGRLATASLGLLMLACEAPSNDETARAARTRPPASPAADPRLDGIPSLVNDTIWRFPSGATVPSRLRAGIAYIGRIDGEGGPYLLAAGVECNYCDASLSVLLQPVSDTTGVLTPDVPGWYVYPGTIRSVEIDGVVEMESRLFWGECRADGAPGLLQVAVDFDTLGRSRRRIRLTELRSGRLVDDSLGAGRLDTAALRRRVDSGRCREIPPDAQ